MTTEDPKGTVDLARERDKRDGHKYRLMQAQQLIDRFTAARGRPPRTIPELQLFVAEAHAKGDKIESPLW